MEFDCNCSDIFLKVEVNIFKEKVIRLKPKGTNPSFLCDEETLNTRISNSKKYNRCTCQDEFALEELKKAKQNKEIKK